MKKGNGEPWGPGWDYPWEEVPPRRERPERERERDQAEEWAAHVGARVYEAWVCREPGE